MEYLDFVAAGAVAVAVGSMIYLGLAVVENSDFSNADAHADMVALAVAATFVSVMIAQRPGWF
ncbi:hypothetical protein NF681_10210 [Comamonadaceae bacterium OTU4NAUVB1]|nr:hypothetical protein NF681_10210 [Comamonadaceae bacterium OTU4NAUVB1]